MNTYIKGKQGLGETKTRDIHLGKAEIRAGINKRFIK